MSGAPQDRKCHEINRYTIIRVCVALSVYVHKYVSVHVHILCEYYRMVQMAPKFATIIIGGPSKPNPCHTNQMSKFG